MAEELISSIFDEPAINAQIKSITGGLEGIVLSIDKIQKAGGGRVPSVAEYDKQLKEQGKTIEELNAKMAAQKKSLDDLTAAMAKSSGERAKGTNGVKDNITQQELLNKALARAELLTLKAAAATTEQGREASKAALQFAEVTKQEKALAREALGITNAYDKLEMEFKELGSAAKVAGAQFGTNSEQFKQASAAAREAGWKLSAIDAGIGNHTRNVGNYASAFNSVNQVMREAPAFANSAQTGFMAISNNLPIMSDQFALLRKETGSSLQAFKIMASGLFGFQAAMSLGITLLTVYGKDIVEWAKNLFKGKQSVDQLELSTGILNETLGEKGNATYKKAISDVNSFKNYIDLSRKGVINKDDVVKKYNDTLGKTMGTVSSFGELEDKITKDAPKFIKMTLLKSVALEAQSRAAESIIKSEQLSRTSAEENISLASKIAGGIAKVANFGLMNEKVNEALKKKGEASRAEAIAEEKEKAAKLNGIAEIYFQQSAKLGKDFDFLELSEDKKSNNEKIKIETQAAENRYKIKLNNLEKEAIILKEAAENDKLSIADRIRAAKALDINKNESIEVEKRGLIEVANLEKKGASEIDLIKSSAMVKRAQEQVANNELLDKIDKDFAKKRAEAENEKFAANKELLEKEAEELKSLSDNDKLSIESRVTNAGLYTNKKIELLKEEEKALLNVATIENASAERRLAISAKIDTEIAKERIKGIGEVAKIEGDIEKQAWAGMASAAISVQEEMGNKLLELNEEYNKKLTGNRDKDKKAHDDYEKEKFRITIKYAVAAIDAQIAILENIDASKRTQKEIDEIKKLYTERTKIIIKGNEDELKSGKKTQEELDSIRKQKQDSLVESVKNITATIKEIANLGFESRKAEIENEKSEIESRYATEVDAINNSTLSAEEKANRLKIIESNKQAQIEANDKKRRQLEVEKAKFDRIANIASIITNTAVAIMAAVKIPPPFGAILAASIGALGAAQLATAIAAPIPKYAKGTDNHKGGLAIVGDGGKREVIVTPMGDSYITPNRSTLLDLPKGSKVYPSEDIFNKIFMKSFSPINLKQVDKKIEQNEQYFQNKQAIDILKKIAKKDNRVTNNINVDLGRQAYLYQQVYS